jgi:DNA gyrase subunit B
MSTAHIRTLLLTFFYCHMWTPIDAGMVFTAQPPLYRVARGKEVLAFAGILAVVIPREEAASGRQVRQPLYRIPEPHGPGSCPDAVAR